MATCTATGVYKVRPGLKAIRSTISYHGYNQFTWRFLSKIVLVELEVRGCDEPIDVGSWHQPFLQDVPYDEVFRTLDRTVVVGNDQKGPDRPDFSMAFFLHMFDPSRTLLTQFGEIGLPAVSSRRPKHLARMRYVFWN